MTQENPLKVFYRALIPPPALLTQQKLGALIIFFSFSLSSVKTASW